MPKVEEVVLQIVICTYNRAHLIEKTLQALAKQEMVDDHTWAVLVVDNNCTDSTLDVVDSYRATLPRLAVVAESRQGLTEARQRGVLSTSAPWVAFIDDDCVPAELWVRNALDFIARQPKAAAFNGRNKLLFPAGVNCPWVHPSMFAGYDPQGVGEQQVFGVLHGAGLVLRRKAVEQSGWLEAPHSADRRGNSLVSGGDNELSIRAGSNGGGLWFVPACSMTHVINEERLQFMYLLRLNFKLAEAGPFMRLIRHESTLVSWHKAMFWQNLRSTCASMGLRRDDMIMENGGVRARLLSFFRSAGGWWGYFRLLIKPVKQKTLCGLSVGTKLKNRRL